MPIQLVITLDETTGAFNVGGPIDNKLICYGLLGMARDAIDERAKQEQRLIQPANGLILPKQ